MRDPLRRYTDEIPNVKFSITGRPEPCIRSGFRLESLVPITAVFKLHEVKPEAVDSDIKFFFQTQLPHLVKNRSDCDLTWCLRQLCFPPRMAHRLCDVRMYLEQ